MTLCRCAYFVITPCCCFQDLFNLDLRVRQEQQEKDLAREAQEAIEEEEEAAAEAQDDAEADEADAAAAANAGEEGEGTQSEEDEEETGAESPGEGDDEGGASADEEEQAGDGTLSGVKSGEEGELMHEPVKKADVRKGLKCAYLETDTGELERCTITKRPKKLKTGSNITAFFDAAKQEYDVPWKSLRMVKNAIQARSPAKGAAVL